MIPAKLTAGEIIRRDPDRLPLSPHVHPPFIRLSEPYDLFMSAGCTLQLDRASMLENRGPKATHVEVAVVRDADATYIVLVPWNDPADRRVAPLSTQPNRRSAVVRTAGDVLIDGGIVMRPGHHYYMTTSLTELEGFGWVVAGNWNAASTKPPRRQYRSVGRAAAEGEDAVAAEIEAEIEAEMEAAADEAAVAAEPADG